MCTAGSKGLGTTCKLDLFVHCALSWITGTFIAAFISTLTALSVMYTAIIAQAARSDDAANEV